MCILVFGRVERSNFVMSNENGVVSSSVVVISVEFCDKLFFEDMVLDGIFG